MKNANVDLDLEVIDMVNGAADHRQRVRENRKMLKRMAWEQSQSRKAAWWRALRSMVLEAGTFAVAGIAVLIAMARGLVDPQMGVPVAFLCMAWTTIRVDRFTRRRADA